MAATSNHYPNPQCSNETFPAPFVLHNNIENWPARKLWSPQYLSENLFKDRKFSCRFGSNRHQPGKILWESETVRKHCLIRELLLKQKTDCHSTEPSVSESNSPVDAAKVNGSSWFYVDYKPLFELLAADQLNDVDWKSFGIDRNAVDSTFWFGSCGAYTPCHYDTYGFNLHAQIHGSKRWILFPPADSKQLQPTRLPYEESSVFSSVDILSAPECLRATNAHVITLNAGDVLYVPPHWWHSVQCISPLAISVNTWIPVPSVDTQSIKHESVTALLIDLFVRNRLIDPDRDLNPDSAGDLEEETMIDDEELIEQGLVDETRFELPDRKEVLAATSALLFGETDSVKRLSDSTLLEPSRCKRSKLDIVEQPELMDIQTEFLTRFRPEGVLVPKMSYDDLYAMLKLGPLKWIDDPKFGDAKSESQIDVNVSDCCSSSDRRELTERDLIQALLHPDTVHVLTRILESKCK